MSLTAPTLSGTTAYEVYNDACLRAVAFNLSFCEGSDLTLAQVMARGWKDAGHVIAGSVVPSITTTDHKACRRGQISTDKKRVSDSSLTVSITAEEWRKFMIALSLCGTEGTALTQAVHTSAAGVTLPFTKAAPSSGPDTWYWLCRTGTTTPVRLLTAHSFSAPAESVSPANATDTIVCSGLVGWANGTRVLLAGTPPTGLSAKDYFVINSTTVATDTVFQLADTVGGTAVQFSTDGTSVTLTQQFDEGEQVITDAIQGRVRFLYPVSQTVTPTLTAPAIDLNSNPDFVFDAVTTMDNLSREGWFHLTGFADDSNTEVVSSWIFSGTIIAKGATGADGTKVTTQEYEITVGANKGTFYVAP